MILDANTHTETNCSIKGSNFSIKASPIAFDILSSKLYSNPVLAVVRELLTNAYDSQVAAGNADKAVDVVFPSAIDTEFSIRDYGTGLSKEDVMTLYTTFFSSTKSDSNDFTGGFGLGSKTPFAYTSSFTVTSFFNGTKYVFLATKKDGYPSILPIGEEPTDEPNGLYIRIPVNKDNGAMANSEFFKETQKYLDFIPEIKVNSNKELTRAQPFLEWDNIKLYKLFRQQGYYHWQLDKGVFIKQGQNIYRIDQYIQDHGFNHDLRDSLDMVDIVYEVPIGTLAITPSREQLSSDESNKIKLKNIAEDLIDKADKIIEYVTHNIDALAGKDIPNTFIDAYANTLYKKYFSFSESLRKYNFRWYRDEIGIDLSTFVMRSIYQDSSERSSYFANKGKYYLLYTKDVSDQKVTRKIRNIIANYDELQCTNDKGTNDVDIRLVDITQTFYTYKELKDVLARIRFLKAIVWTLNNAEEFNFDIELMPITEFFRRFPNCKQPRKSSGKPRAARTINAYRVDVRSADSSCEFKIASQEDLKCWNPKNTLTVFVDTKQETVNSVFNRLVKFFRYIPFSFKDINNNAFIANYLYEKLGIIPSADDPFHCVYLIITAKGNKNKFTEYNSIGVEDLFDLVKNTEFKCYQQYTGSWRPYISYFSDYVEGLKEPYKTIIESSNLYKRHSLISQYGYNIKPYNAYKYNYIDYMCNNYLTITLGVDRDKFYPSRSNFVDRVVNRDLSVLYYFIQRRRCWRNGRWTLTNKDTQRVLSFLRGEKYVLL